MDGLMGEFYGKTYKPGIDHRIAVRVPLWNAALDSAMAEQRVEFGPGHLAGVFRIAEQWGGHGRRGEWGDDEADKEEQHWEEPSQGAMIDRVVGMCCRGG